MKVNYFSAETLSLHRAHGMLCFPASNCQRKAKVLGKILQVSATIDRFELVINHHTIVTVSIRRVRRRKSRKKMNSEPVLTVVAISTKQLVIAQKIRSATEVAPVLVQHFPDKI